MRDFARHGTANRRAVIVGLFIGLLLLAIAWLGPLLLQHTPLSHEATGDAAARPATPTTAPLSTSEETD